MHPSTVPPAPASRRTTPRPAADPRLPQLAVLLDADAMAPCLQRTLPPGARLESVRVRHVDLVPGRGATVGYEATIGGERHAVVAVTDAAGHTRALAGSPAARAAAVDPAPTPALRPVVFDEAVPALIQWSPVDLALPLLAAPPAFLCRLAGCAGSAPALLGHRPGHNAIVRCGDAVLKLYASDAGLAAGLRGLLFAERVRGIGPVPPVRGCFEQLRVTVQGAVDGAVVPRERALALAREAGVLLRALHAAPVEGLPATTPADQLAIAARAGALVAAVAPRLAPRVQGLLAGLERSCPHATTGVASHGDFNVSQLLDVHGRLVLVDFDEARVAAPALDLAAYAANVVSGRPGDPGHAQEVLAAVVDGYGARPDQLAWHLSAELLRRAASPFRRFKRDWPERTAAVVAAAEEVLGR